jgi:hypothetical protein
MKYFSMLLSSISYWWNGLIFEFLLIIEYFQSSFLLNLFQGYEIFGLENIPENNGAVLVIYHAPLPLDFFYLGAKFILNKKRQLKIIADKSFFDVFGKPR